jgi:hypothetical protein
MLVWAHHMFAVGMPVRAAVFFMISDDADRGADRREDLQLARDDVAREPHFDTPMLFALGFIAVFTIGGLSGVFLAAFPVDWQVTTPTSSSRTSTTCSSAARCSASSPGSTTGGRRCSAGCSTSARQGALLAHVRRLQPDVLPAALLGLLGMPRRV